MEKKILLLDTNAIYLLSGIETNKYDLNKIKELCMNNECWVNLYSIFEIYNNTNRTLEDINKIIKMLQALNIKICCNDIMHSSFGNSLDLSIITQQNVTAIRDKLSKGILPVYSKLFSFLSTVNYFIGYMLKENEDEEYYKQLSNFVCKILPIVDNHVRLVIEKNLSENLFSEKYLKNLYAELLSSFQLAILLCDEKYAKLDKDVKNSKLYFDCLLKEFEKKDFMCSYMRFVMQGSHNQENNILPNMYQMFFKPKYSTEADADCLFNDIVNLIFRLSDEIEKAWFKYMLKSLLYYEANLRSNDFIDYLIIKDFTLEDKIDYLITFDGSMQKIMKNLNFNTKLAESLEVIENLK